MIKSHHIRKLLACVLAVGVCMTCSPLTALADDNGAATIGEGTLDNPTITTTITTDYKTDSDTGETVTTVKTEKNWQGSDSNNKSDGTADNSGTENQSQTTITGKDTSTTSETRDESKNLLSGFGNSKGFQTTKTTTFDTPTEIMAGEIASEAEPIELTLKPGDENISDTRNVHAWFTPTVEIVPSWVGDKKTDGTIDWKNGSSSKDDNVITTITKVGDTSKAGKVTYTREIVSPLKVETDIYSYTIDKDSHIIAWSSDSSVTVPVAATELPKYVTIFANGNNTVSAFELPKKPVVSEENKPVYGSEESNKDKIMSGQLVSDILDDNGNVVGYALITYENGKEVKCEAFMGTTVTTTTTTENEENGLKKYTTTKTIHSQAKGSVISNDVKDAERTVTAKMEEIKGTINAPITSITTYEPKRKAPYSTTTTYGSDLIFKNTFSSGTKYDGDYDIGNLHWFDKVGYGLGSTILVNTTEYTGINAHQFILTYSADKENNSADKKLYYVYCADLAVNPQDKAVYNMQRLEDTDYYKNSGVTGKTLDEIRNQIRAIVLNGYWGTEANTDGSIENFRNMLKDKLVKSTDSKGNKTYYDVANITEGMAMTATQAAIWYYGNSDNSDTIKGDFIVPENDEEKDRLIKAIYQYLVNKDGNGLSPQPATTANTLLAKEDFAKSVKLTVGDKTDDGNYNVVIDITMDKITSGSLTLTVGTVDADDNKKTNPIATYSLNGDCYANGAYHISGLELPAGVDITLSFSGTQTLANGVYLFSSYKKGTDETASQTFIGAGQAEQSINLSTSFNFSVTEPEFEITSSNSEYTADMIEWESRYEITENRQPHNWNWTKGDTPIPDGEDDPSGETNSEDPTDYPNKPDVNTEKVNSSSKANDADSETATEDANVPKTGDVNDLLVSWFILTAVSAAGCMALLKRKLRSK